MSRTAPEDEPVLASVTRGDRRGAIALLIELHEATVFGYCVRLLRDRELAEDVAQQVFIEAHRDIERFRGESSLRTWLVGIAHHRCNDAIKARGRRDARIELDPEAAAEHEAAAPPPAEVIDRVRQVAALEDCLAELSSDVRELLLLRFVSEMSYEDMAELLRKKADTLRARVVRTLPQLKDCLASKGWNHG